MPFTLVLPAPQAAAISVIMLSGCASMGAMGVACADTARDRANAPIAINLIILTSSKSDEWTKLTPHLLARLEMDQGFLTNAASSSVLG
ncbi:MULTISPECIES: hypothetical protein [Bradyrhizobium]|uniref:hypothetical protein n=1 Tax=Bradyrhizobium TaxID=374 RepID=UPI001302A983|nr:MULTISPECIES: hypothetical protein [Bradyrhizobium]WOH61014.1 hypothetical protein RX329_13290 [Bradyrhizobium sp. BWC-3-1]